jgi:small subunit ribosomal protein S8
VAEAAVICENSVSVACVFVSLPVGVKSLELERQVGNMTNYPLGDFLIRIKNAVMAGQKDVVFPVSKKAKAVALVLKKLGYLDEVSSTKDELKISLAIRRKEPILIDLKLVSKPGLRIYKSADDLKARRGISILILSTSRGMMSSKEAIKEGVGGEAIVEIW